MGNNCEGRSVEQLSDQQEAALQRLSTLIRAFPDQKAFLPKEEQHGTFGLFGARGAGKSTVAAQLKKRIEDEKSRVVVLDPPLDCTSLPRDIHLGISIGEYLAHWVERAWEDHNPCKKGQDSVARKLRDKLINAFLPLDREYRRLRLSLAVTSSEYRQIAQKELTSRHRVQSAVKEVLGDLMAELESWDETSSKKRIGAFVIVLEDADLSVGRLNAELLSVFMNDFADERLLFVIVADEEHLEQRLTEDGGLSSRPSSSSGPSGRTVLRMLDKLIPVSHRVYIDSWTPSSALEFVPLSSKGEQPENLQTKITNAFERVLRPPARRSLRLQDLYLLLPTTPRGLSDLYRQLDEMVSAASPSQGKGGGTNRRSKEVHAPRDYEREELLAVLAHCRGEHALARRLTQHSVDWRAARATWSDEKLAQTSWQRIAFEARSDAPIWALEPSQPLFPDLEPGADDALWAELLLNLSCRDRYDFLRSVLGERFLPLRERIQRCKVEFRVDELSGLLRLHRKHPGLLRSPWLRFRQIEEKDEQEKVHTPFVAEAGWHHLFFQTAEDTDQTLEFFEDRLVGQNIRPSARSSSAEVAPREVRSLIVLVDQLSQLPWRQLEIWSGQEPDWSKLPLLLTILCGQAYELAVEERLRAETWAEGAAEPPSQKPKDDFDTLREQPKDELVASIQSLRRRVEERHEKLSAQQKNHPLVLATEMFLDTLARTDTAPDP